MCNPKYALQLVIVAIVKTMKPETLQSPTVNTFCDVVIEHSLFCCAVCVLQEMESVRDVFEKEWTEGAFPGWPVGNLVNSWVYF